MAAKLRERGPLEPGLNPIPDRAGQPMQVLCWESGTRSVQEGKDLASVVGQLSTEQLEFWSERMKSLHHESRIIEAEKDRRKVEDLKGGLWEWAREHNQ